ncbi:hypothetical protein VKT23_006732 [Stygiomarasmius scandens]|uniref:GATA-type domain-containing protein n=1 Tax=Marasmiellus scandens TaxID=2682957 RepID=A0ABR1JQ01_9AGAR
MAAAHPAAQRPTYSLPPPGYNDSVRLPSIKDLELRYDRPRQDPLPSQPPPPHPSQPLPEYASSVQERSARHPQHWARPIHHSVPPSALPAHQHLQHNPPLSAGHEIPSRPDEYPSKHDNGGYVTPGPASLQVNPVPISAPPIRSDEHSHLRANKRARTTSLTPTVPTREPRPPQPAYQPSYHQPHQPQYQAAPPPPSPYPPVSSAPPTTHQAPPPPIHDMHHQQPSPLPSHHGYPQYSQQQQYVQSRAGNIPQHAPQHAHHSHHAPQHSNAPPPPPPLPPAVQSQPSLSSQSVSYTSGAPPPPPPPPPSSTQDHWEQHHQPPVRQVHQQQQPPPPQPAEVHHAHPPPHYAHHPSQPPPPTQHQMTPASAPTPAPPPAPPTQHSNYGPQPVHTPQSLQHAQPYRTIAPSEIEHRPSVSYPPPPPPEPEKNPREKTLDQIVNLCSILYDFASRYAQLNAALPYAQPSVTEIADMANKANEVVKLLEELRRLSMAEPERIKVDTPAVAAAVVASSPDDHRPPKRPWEDMSQDGQASTAQPESGGMFSEPFSASAQPADPPPPASAQTTAEQDMELIRTKRATTAAGAAASAGQPKSKYRKRSRATPPGKCHSCNIKETPEWRRGPDGARTLCNACGLHYAKLMRKQSKLGETAPSIDIETLRASTRAAEADKNSRHKQDSDRHGSPANNSAPATPHTTHHQSSFQVLNMSEQNQASSSSASSSSETRTLQPIGQPPPPPWSVSRSFGTAPEQIQHQSYLRSSHGASPR